MPEQTAIQSPEGDVSRKMGRRVRKTAVEVITTEARCVAPYHAVLTHNPVSGRYGRIRQEVDGNPNRDDLPADTKEDDQ